MNRIYASVVACLFVAAPVVGQDNSQQAVAQAVLPLPVEMRAGAGVIAYEPGADPVILRARTNEWICEADAPTPGILLRCHHVNIEDYRNRDRELTAEGRTQDEIRPMLGEEMKSGELEMPGYSVEFLMRGPDLEGAIPWSIVRLPFATGESTGLQTEPNSHRPWLMRAGEGSAHIMFPGN